MSFKLWCNKIFTNFNKANFFMRNKKNNKKRNDKKEVKGIANGTPYKIDTNKSNYTTYNVEHSIIQNISSFLGYNCEILNGIAIYSALYLLAVKKNEAINFVLKLLFFPINVKIALNEVPLIFLGWVGTSLLVVGIYSSFFNGLPKKVQKFIHDVALALLYYQFAIWIYRFIVNPPFNIFLFFVAVILYWWIWLDIIETKIEWVFWDRYLLQRK